MTERRFSKLDLLKDGAFEAENAAAPVALMPWGGSKGPAIEAFRELRDAGTDLAWFYTMYLNPLPEKLLEQLKQKELVLVPELNYLGQFSSILRSQGVRAESITQYTGLPFKVCDLVEHISERLETKKKSRVATS